LDEQSTTTPLVDPRYLVNVLIELQVAIRKLSLYSISHAIVPSLLESLEKHFGALFGFIDTATFGITRHEVLYQGNAVSANNPVVRELARGLNQFNLASMTFIKGLTKEEILKFLRLLVENRGQTSEKKEERVSQFHQEVPSIRLKLISFGEAIKGRQNEADPSSPQKTDLAGKELWRGLVRQLMQENSEVEQQLLNKESSNEPDLEVLAELINRLCQGEKGNAQSYERAIVRYLNQQANRQALNSDQQVRLNRELSQVLSNLNSDVREQIFRISLEDTQNGMIAIEELLDVLPTPMILEALSQIQLSHQNISSPMMSLLKKFTDLSLQDEKIQELLASKLEDHKDLFQELLTSRASRAFYPTSYRSFLDQELITQPTGGGNSPAGTHTEIDPVKVNHHLTLVILELLEGPVHSQSEYEGLINQMNRLLAEGLGENTQPILLETLVLLSKKLASVGEEDGRFLRKEIKKFVKPEVLTQLLLADRMEGNESVVELLGLIREIAGAEVIPMFLDLLETEENLSVRKRLLGLIVQCGSPVIPLAVKRLKSTKWYVVRNMLVLLRDLGATEALPEIVRCMKQDSSKMKMAALQAVETLGKGTEYFYQALSLGLKDRDPGIFRKAVSLIVIDQDPRAMDLITTQLRYSWQQKNHTPLLTLLEMIRKAGTPSFLPALIKLRRRLWLRFWQWSRQRALYKAVSQTIHELGVRKRNHA
jgi:hypothetical protein